MEVQAEPRNLKARPAPGEPGPCRRMTRTRTWMIISAGAATVRRSRRAPPAGRVGRPRPAGPGSESD